MVHSLALNIPLGLGGKASGLGLPNSLALQNRVFPPTITML